jgi:hypothetical protein
MPELQEATRQSATEAIGEYLYHHHAEYVEEREILDLPEVQKYYESKLKAENENLKQALDDDANDLWRVTNEIKKVIESRDWITQGRGEAAWDDAQYQKETGIAFDAVLQLIATVQHPAQLRFHKVIGNWNSPLKEEITKLKAEIARLKESIEFYKDMAKG